MTYSNLEFIPFTVILLLFVVPLFVHNSVFVSSTLCRMYFSVLYTKTASACINHGYIIDINPFWLWASKVELSTCKIAMIWCSNIQYTLDALNSEHKRPNTIRRPRKQKAHADKWRNEAFIKNIFIYKKLFFLFMFNGNEWHSRSTKWFSVCYLCYFWYVSCVVVHYTVCYTHCVLYLFLLFFRRKNVEERKRKRKGIVALAEYLFGC